MICGRTGDAFRNASVIDAGGCRSVDRFAKNGGALPMSPREQPLPVTRGELEALIAANDWSRTPLGPSAGWSASLRTVLQLMLTSRYAMWLGWGPDLNFFYN